MHRNLSDDFDYSGTQRKYVFSENIIIREDFIDTKPILSQSSDPQFKK